MEAAIEKVDVFVVYDLETTGFDVLKDRIVQFAAIVWKVCPQNEKAPRADLDPISLCSLVNPGWRRMNPRASEITKITDARLSSAPPFHVVWARFMDLVERCVPPGRRISSLRLVGHNSRTFDDRMLCVVTTSASRSRFAP